MRIFFLDDMLIRRQVFAKVHAEHEVVFAETAQEAIEILKKDLKFDIISVDHDLGGEVFCSSELENSGYRVAVFLSDKEVKGRIVIHSWNPSGAKKMLEILPQASYQPFNPLVKYTLETINE